MKHYDEEQLPEELRSLARAVETLMSRSDPVEPGFNKADAERYTQAVSDALGDARRDEALYALINVLHDALFLEHESTPVEKLN
jgi:predicted nuclease with TOPRIM domain